MNHKSAPKKTVKWLLPLLILLVAGLGSLAIIKSRKAPEKRPTTNPGVMVETLEVVRRSQPAVVFATGLVEPWQEISLVAEVSGKLTWISPRFVNGGFFKKGEKLLEIDPRDYRLAVEKSKAELARAKTNLQMEQEQAAIARQEWENLELKDKGTPGPLVLRQPQLASEHANLAAAQAGLDQALLNLERTSIRAPFNGRLHNKQVDLGEYVRVGTPLAMLAGTDRAEIITPLPIEDLQWLKIPLAGSDQTGSPCTISTQVGSRRYQWQGSVIRAHGEIDKTTRMAKIVIGSKDPYNLLRHDKKTDLPLTNGLFVELEMTGSQLEQVVAIPRNALREGDVVWLMNDKNLLEIRPVHVLRRQQQTLLIDQGLQGGEQLILTSISGAAPGMKLRRQSRGNPK